MCPLLESDETSVEIVIILILWGLGVFIYDQWWKRRGEKEYKKYWKHRPPNR